MSLEEEPSRLSLVRIGRRPPCRVLLHGFGANSGTFHRLLPHLDRAGSLLLVDLPAHGKSSPLAAAPEPEEMAKAICQRLRALDVERFDLIGHSLGGLVATKMAVISPKNVSRLHLLSCAGVGPDLNMAFFRAFIAATAPSDLACHLALAYAIRPDDLLKGARVVMDWLCRPGVRPYVSRIVDNARSFKADIDGVLALGIPVAALWGAQDRISPVANAKTLPAKVSLTILRSAGHVPHIEAPREVASWINAAHG